MTNNSCNFFIQWLLYESIWVVGFKILITFLISMINYPDNYDYYMDFCSLDSKCIVSLLKVDLASSKKFYRYYGIALEVNEILP